MTTNRKLQFALIASVIGLLTFAENCLAARVGADFTQKMHKLRQDLMDSDGGLTLSRLCRTR